MLNYKDCTVNDLVELAKNKDEIAFYEICMQFKPLYFDMFKKYKNVYRVQSEDWLQEMRIITHEAILKYDLNKGANRTFGVYLKQAITFRLIDEWRRQKTKRQQFINHECMATSLEDICKKQDSQSRPFFQFEEQAHVNYLIPKITESLTIYEFKMLLILMGELEQGDFTQAQINIARRKLRFKIKSILN